ncbi:hypothetical protein C8F04DRAFT_1176842 [Mycena alexandri]|uniref:Uncharacterized protein n=1 Tax=Mycena alexandri TaxID=1745969 RepID=A0AAD6XBC3_9AGAR|nr:hypothetical protein C8F04DRAFT_1176842 [Mycena alexandri]
MAQLGISLNQIASKDFQEVLRVSGALPTRWSPRRLNVHRWHLIKSTTIYPRLCEMVDLLKITEPELLDKLYVTPLAGYIFVGVHNSLSLYSVQDVTGGALRALTKKSAENAAQVATTMCTGSDAKTARAGVPLTGPVKPVKTVTVSIPTVWGLPYPQEPLEQSIGYGDPMGGDDEASDVCAALHWFVEKHHLSLNEVEHLLCTRQQDVWTCGLYAPGAIAHKYLPGEYPLISPEFELGDLGKLDMLRCIILRFHERCLPTAKALPSFLTQGLTEYAGVPRSMRHSRSPSPVTPPGLEFAMQSLSVSPKKPPRKRPKTQQSSSGTVATLIAPIFKPPKLKKTVNKVVAKERKASNKPTAKARKLMKAAAIKVVMGKFGSVQVRGTFARTLNLNFGSGSANC